MAANLDVGQSVSGAREALAKLSTSGVKRIVMLTGDNAATAQAFAAELCELLHAAAIAKAESNGADVPAESVPPIFVCPDCGADMIIVDTLVRAQRIHASPQPRGAP